MSGVVALGAPNRDQLAIHPLLWAQALVLGLGGSLGVRGLLRFTCAAGGCCARFRSDLEAPLSPSVGYLSVYSRLDGVVDWRACLDPEGRHVDVFASHCGMVAHGPTLHVVAGALDRFGGASVGDRRDEARIAA